MMADDARGIIQTQRAGQRRTIVNHHITRLMALVVVPIATVLLLGADARTQRPESDDPPPIELGSASPAERPAWVETNGELQAARYSIAVKSGLFVTEAECEAGLEKVEQEAVKDYVEAYLGSEAAELVVLDSKYIQDTLVKARYHEVVTKSVGDMQQLHALLVFDDDVRTELHQRLAQGIDLPASQARRLGSGGRIDGGGHGLWLSAEHGEEAGNAREILEWPRGLFCRKRCAARGCGTVLAESMVAMGRRLGDTHIHVRDPSLCIPARARPKRPPCRESARAIACWSIGFVKRIKTPGGS